MRATIVVRGHHGKEDILWGNTLEVTDRGVLMVYNEEITAKTTTVVSERFLSGPRTTTETVIEKKKYITASYPEGEWTAAYSQVSKVEPKVSNEPYN